MADMYVPSDLPLGHIR